MDLRSLESVKIFLVESRKEIYLCNNDFQLKIAQNFSD